VAGRAVVGLDIGSSGVRAAQLAQGKGGTTLQRVGQVALPPGAVRDGEVVDVDAVATGIRTLWAQAGFTSRRVAVGVANQRVVVRQVELPALPLAELRSSLQYHVQESIPMPVDQALLDCYPYDEAVDGRGNRTVRVLLVAASRDMVEHTLRAVGLAGLQPVGVDLTSFAVLRSLATAGSSAAPGGAEVLVDIGAGVTNLVVHQGGVPRFVRILLRGGEHVTDALSERLGIPLEDAEVLKRARGAAPAPVVHWPGGAGGAGGDAASRAIELAVGSFVDEVRGSLDYYAAQPDAVRVDRMVVCGGGSRLDGLAARLGAATQLPVQPGSPLPELLPGPTGLDADQLEQLAPLLSVPVGLALGMAS
jgi:type IV pilus assembly protein PilM